MCTKYDLNLHILYSLLYLLYFTLKYILYFSFLAFAVNKQTFPVNKIYVLHRKLKQIASIGYMVEFQFKVASKECQH